MSIKKPKYTVSPLTLAQLELARRENEINFDDHDESDDDADGDDCCDNFYGSVNDRSQQSELKHKRTSMRPGQNVLRKGGMHPNDYNGEFDSSKPSNKPTYYNQAVPGTPADVMRYFTSLTSREELTKMVALKSDLKDVRFLRTVAGIAGKQLDKLFHVVADELHSLAIVFVSYTKNWTTRNHLKLSCATLLHKSLVEVTAFVRAVAKINKTGAFPTAIDTTFVQGGTTVFSENTYKVLIDNFYAERGPLLGRYVANPDVISEIFRIENFIGRAQRDGACAPVMAGIIDVVCSGETTNKDNSDHFIMKFIGEGVSLVLASQLCRAFEEIFGRRTHQTVNDFNIITIGSELERKCDSVNAFLSREHIQDYEQLDRYVTGPILTLVKQLVVLDQNDLREYCIVLKETLEKSINCDVVISQDVISASDLALRRVVNCCPSCRKYITKTLLMQGDEVYISFGELTAMILMQTMFTKSFQQTSVLERLEKSIGRLESDFALKLRWVPLQNKLVM